jgi:hypothetical protein
MQLANAMAQEYRALGEGLSVTLVGVRTFETRGVEELEGLLTDAVRARKAPYSPTSHAALHTKPPYNKVI